MELKIEIGYEQILALIQQLPDSELLKLKIELDKKLEQESLERSKLLQTMLLNGPTMSDEQYEDFLDFRKNFNEWRKI